MGSALIRNVVPEIFTEQGVTFQGSLYPAAYAITYGPDGQAGAPVLVAACQSAAPAGCTATPIPRPAGSRVFLELFATGIRNDASSVTVSLLSSAGVSQTVAPQYAGPQGQYDGLDQVNLEITSLPTAPASPSGPPGTLYTLTLNVDGFISNPVQFAVQ